MYVLVLALLVNASASVYRSLEFCFILRWSY